MSNELTEYRIPAKHAELLADRLKTLLIRSRNVNPDDVITITVPTAGYMRERTTEVRPMSSWYPEGGCPECERHAKRWASQAPKRSLNLPHVKEEADE